MKKVEAIVLALSLCINVACEELALEDGVLSPIGGEIGNEIEQDSEIQGSSFCSGTVATVRSGLNVRTSPEIADNICAVIPKGEEVQISLQGGSGDFFKIKSELCSETSDFVYMSKKYIDFDSNCNFESEEQEAEEPPQQEPRPKIIAMNWDGKHKDYKKWTRYAYEAVSQLGQDLLNSKPQDIKTFCPNYSNLDIERKKMFWIFLISSMTQYESGFKPQTKYKEAFSDSSGRPVISRGLLQISIESARGYRCDLDRAEDLHLAQKNLECGVRILNRWLRRDERLAGKVSGKWRGGARYWSVLRKRSGSQSHDRIVAKTRATSICKD